MTADEKPGEPQQRGGRRASLGHEAAQIKLDGDTRSSRTAVNGALEWYADAATWTSFTGVMFTDARMAGTASEVDEIIRLLDLRPGASVLDLCCGPGRHALELARRGFKVTGVDLNAAYIKQAREAAQAEKLHVEFVESDARDFCRPAGFDAAISMYTSFGYFEDIGDDVKVLENVCASLRPGGAMVIETFGKEAISRRYEHRTCRRQGDDLLLAEHIIIGPWERMELRWTLVHPDGTRAEASLRIRLYSAVEMASVVRQAGFDSIDIFGNLDGASYDHLAQQLVAVARR
jgi:SAM-dependent methyltransferase